MTMCILIFVFIDECEVADMLRGAHIGRVREIGSRTTVGGRDCMRKYDTASLVHGRPANGIHTIPVPSTWRFRLTP